MKSNIKEVKGQKGVVYAYLDKTIGNGGAGKIHQCHELGSDECIFAIKILNDNNNDNNEKNRFDNEIEFQKENKSPYIIPCIDNGTLDDDERFYIMPLCKTTLRKLMNNGKKYTGFKKLKWFLDVCRGVKAAHDSDVIHRDIKPENILMYDDKLALCDFGIAHFSDSTITKKGDRLANFNYHAPEQKKGSQDGLSKATDIFALGLILNEMFTNKIYQGGSPTKISDVAPSFGYLDEIVSDMVNSDPKKRESDINNIINVIEFRLAEMKEDFEDFEESIKISPIPDNISISDIDNALMHIYEDLKLANILINDDRTPWNEINTNYHMNYGYSAKSLFDTILFIRIYEVVNNMFGYESNVYMSGEKYKPHDCDGEDLENFNLFFEQISKLKTIWIHSNNDFNNMKGRCIKSFQSLCNYHAIEVLEEEIEGIPNALKEHLCDAPILHIAAYINEDIRIVKKELGLLEFRFEDWIEIDWERYDPNIKSPKLFKTDWQAEKSNNIETELKKRFNNLTIKREYDGFQLYFSYGEWSIFKELCQSKIDESNKASERYVLNGDIMGLYSNPTFAGKYVLLCLDNYEFHSVLYKVLSES